MEMTSPRNKMTMTEVQILHLVDDPVDSELFLEALSSAGLNCEVVRVDSGADFTQALKARTFDLIISDFSLPNFDGRSALDYASKHYPDIPFIFVSGTLGEDAAIESLVNGATDYVFKHKLSRLAAAVQRALRESRARKEYRLSEQAIHKSEARYRMLFEYSPDGILIANSDNMYVDVNKSACQMFGYTHDELVGLNPSFIVAATDLKSLGRALDSIKANSDYQREWQFRRKDGSIFDAEVIATMMPDGNRLAIIRDITEQKHFVRALRQKNLELEEANRMKSEFLATMSHELRTPLNSIIGFSEVLRDGLVGEMTDKQKGFIGDISSSGNHLLSIINDILDLSKVEAGKMTLDLEPVLIASLLDNSLSVVREKANTRHIEIDMDVPGDLGSVQADPRRKVKQIVYNLLSNAVKVRAKEGGQVSFARRPRRECPGRSFVWPFGQAGAFR